MKNLYVGGGGYNGEAYGLDKQAPREGLVSNLLAIARGWFNRGQLPTLVHGKPLEYLRVNPSLWPSSSPPNPRIRQSNRPFRIPIRGRLEASQHQGDTMRVCHYMRVSTAEQGDSRNGLEAQALTLERFATQGGHEVCASFEEVASGKLGLDRRPVLRACFEQARRLGAVVVVSKLDRLSRSVEFVAGLMNNGARFATVEDGLEVQPFQLHLKAMLAEHERRTIGERTKAALGALRARGVAVGIPAHTDPSSGGRARALAAQAIKNEADSFARHLAPVVLRMKGSGMTLAQMAEELNAQGNRTARGGRWHASTVCALLKRLRCMG